MADPPHHQPNEDQARSMIRAATALIVLLFTAEIGSEAVEVKNRGAVDLGTFECRDTPRSTVIQRACYDQAQAAMILSVKGTYYQYCELPPATFESLMAAPSMGQFFKQNFADAGSDGRYDCDIRRVRGFNENLGKIGRQQHPNVEIRPEKKPGK